MRIVLLRAMAGAWFLLCGSAAEGAQADGKFANASLRGTYSYVNNTENAASFGLITFDGKGSRTATIKVNLPEGNKGRKVVALSGSGTYTVEAAGTGSAKIMLGSETPYDFVITHVARRGQDNSLLATEVFAVARVGGLYGQLVALTWTRRSD